LYVTLYVHPLQVKNKLHEEVQIFVYSGEG
jgi:hypothetical protein